MCKNCLYLCVRSEGEDESQILPATLIACDSGSWGIEECVPNVVNQIDYRVLLQLQHPHIVICSWMPQGIDFTADFRATPSVQEYYLIGESDTGITGHAWKTWGASPLPEPERPKPPYVRD